MHLKRRLEYSSEYPISECQILKESWRSYIVASPGQLRNRKVPQHYHGATICCDGQLIRDQAIFSAPAKIPQDHLPHHITALITKLGASNMVKTRMGMLDLRVQASTLNTKLSGARVANVYDAHNGRTYVLKLAVPPKEDENRPWEKKLLLIESGSRIHITAYDREKDLPTGFCLKLRKHLRARRLDCVRQVGGDRILELVFSGGGEVVARLIVEMFSGGNILLTDMEYTILTLLRTYRPVDGGKGALAVRERYPVEKGRIADKLGFSEFRDCVRRAVSNVPGEEEMKKAQNRAARRKLVDKSIPKKALAIVLKMEPALIEHALLKGGFSEGSLTHLMEDDNVLSRVFEEIERINDVIRQRIEGGEVGGVIVCAAEEGSKKYDEFWPFLFEQFKGRRVEEFESFDEAADDFFSRLEAERAEAAQLKREAGVFRKVDKLANELKGQVSMFENARDLSWERAQAIEGNIAEVEAAITVIRSAIAAAVSWDGLAKMVAEEKKNGNPVAEIIHSLQLEKNEITLMLEDTFGVHDEEEEEEEGDDDDGNDSNDDDDDDEEDGDDVFNTQNDDGGAARNGGGSRPVSQCGRRRQKFEPTAQTRKALLVSVDLSLGAHANARRHYEIRKSAAAKMEKAVAVTDRTLKAASKRAATEAHKIEEEAVAASIRARRKTLWFEKFFWFVSSENYLVVAGRDAQQNELLVNRYLAPADIYVHADLAGASSVIVKNRRRLGTSTHAEIPRMTLEQAGTFAMCRSAAWESKIVTSAWWVRASQISKTTASGAYLPTGSFIIRGKKNFLDPAQLVMGLAFIFKVDEASAVRHKGEREVRGLDEEDKEEVVSEEVKRLKSTGILGNVVPEAASETVLDELQEHSDSVDQEKSHVFSGNDKNLGKTVVQEEPETTSTDQVEEDVDGEQKEEQECFKDESELVSLQKVPRTKKKHMSAKERRARKSANASAQTSFDGSVLSSEQDSDISGSAGAPTKKNSKSNAQLPRGKKHKLRKMKKYSDQDEEERRIALAVLGSKPIKEEEHGEEEYDTDSKEDDSNDPGGKNRNPHSEHLKRREHDERRETMRLLQEEGLEELANLEKETLETLDVLTAIPESTDTVQFALPVCAPYGALTNYRYKVKLMPGSTKRGKAYRSAMVLFQKQAEKDLSRFKQERDAIRLSPESDGIQGMLGSVKIMAPGLAEAQRAVQKAKKGSTKKDGSSKKGARQK